MVHRLIPSALVLVLWSAGTACLPASVGARFIFETEHNPVRAAPPIPYEDVSFQSEGVVLRGWLFRTAATRRGTVVFLHGRNHNREDAIPIAVRLVPSGYDVLAYDSRAHGESTGKYSTFGYFEKHDLSRAIDYLGGIDVVVMGVSLGAAVALQAAAEDSRIAGVIAISSFTTLQQIVREQIPGIVPTPWVRGTLRNAEQLVGIRVDEVDTLRAARQIQVPVLLLHGVADNFIIPDHSIRIFEALAGPREVVLVEGARHNDVLEHKLAWNAVWTWLSSWPHVADTKGATELTLSPAQRRGQL